MGKAIIINLLLNMKLKLMIMLSLLLLPATLTNALVPYMTRPSLLDMMLPLDDPFRILEQNPFDNVPKGGGGGLHHETLALASADWKETPTAHIIALDVPGMKKENLKIEAEEHAGVLRISGARQAEAQVEGDKWHRAERTNGQFWRQFKLPGNADLEGIKAHLEDGVLRITVPKFAAEIKKQPRLINIAHGDADSGTISNANVKVA